MQIQWFGSLVLLLFSCSQAKQLQDAGSPFADCLQIVVVVSPDNSSTTAQLWTFERTMEKWSQTAGPFNVMLGRNGLAWGTGVHHPSFIKRPVKKEGDGKSPAGIFRFGKAFGYAPDNEAGFKLPYSRATPYLECIDDPLSPYYNILADTRLFTSDWQSSEKMLRTDHQYKWGIFIEHNTPAVAGDGSCIFFHIMKEPGAATAGCTSLEEENLLTVMRWLDPEKKPLLVQLTKADYAVFQKKYALPVLH